MNIYFRVIVFFLPLISCSHRSIESNNGVFSFLNTSKGNVASLTLGEYKAWLEDSIHKSVTYFENDSFQVSLMYRPSVFETAFSLANNKNADYDEIFKEKNQYHLFVAECLDKRPETLMKLKGGSEFLNSLSKKVFVLNNHHDTLERLVEIFPSMVVNKPSHIYILIPKTEQTNSIKTCIDNRILGAKDIMSLSVDSVFLSSLPNLKK